MCAAAFPIPANRRLLQADASVWHGRIDCSALPKQRVRVRLTVAFPDIQDPTAVIERVVNDIWNPEGLVFEWMTGSTQVPWSAIDVWLAVVGRPPSERAHGVMGELLFDQGHPQPLIRVFVEPAIEWVRRDETTRFQTDSRVSNLTIGNTAALLPTALAYVAAHEIGHFVLGSPVHAAEGVMQAQLRGAHRLLSAPRLPALDSANRKKLGARLAARAACTE
jgi:hypothetical protein